MWLFDTTIALGAQQATTSSHLALLQIRERSPATSLQHSKSLEFSIATPLARRKGPKKGGATQRRQHQGALSAITEREPSPKRTGSLPSVGTRNPSTDRATRGAQRPRPTSRVGRSCLDIPERYARWDSWASL